MAPICAAPYSALSSLMPQACGNPPLDAPPTSAASRRRQNQAPLSRSTFTRAQPAASVPASSVTLASWPTYCDISSAQFASPCQGVWRPRRSVVPTRTGPYWTVSSVMPQTVGIDPDPVTTGTPPPTSCMSRMRQNQSPLSVSTWTTGQPEPSVPKSSVTVPVWPTYGIISSTQFASPSTGRCCPRRTVEPTRMLPKSAVSRAIPQAWGMPCALYSGSTTAPTDGPLPQVSGR